MNKRNTIVMLTLAILAFSMIGTAAGNGNEITFVLGTDENHASLVNASGNVSVGVNIYNTTQAKMLNFSNESVLFLSSLDNETVSWVNSTISSSAKVITYNLSTTISIGNVDDVNITKYWVYGGEENIENLITYMDNKFYGNATAVDQPKPPGNRPKIAFVLSRPCALTLVNGASNDPFISDMLNVTAYLGRSDLNLSYNLSGKDVVLLRDLAPSVVEKLEGRVNAAKSDGAYIIAVGPSEQSYNLHNVNISDPEYSNITEYLEYPSKENFKRLIVFIGVKFCNTSAQVLPPVSRPVYGIYHPYAPEIFTNITDYVEWYDSAGRYNRSNPTVGIVTGSYKRMDRDSALLDALIESFESRNVNVIVSTYTYHDPHSMDYLMEDGKSVVDGIIAISRGSPINYKNASQGICDLQTLNVTTLNGARLFYSMTPEEWEAGSHGIPPVQSYQVAFAELDGIIEPIVISGKAIDPVTGIEYNKPIDYQIDWLTNRTISWMRLHRMNNSDKKIVIPYYSAGGGKANVGSDIDYYLDTQASLTNLLAEMDERGYDLGTGSLPNKTELTDLMAHQGSNFGVWAPGSLNERVEQGNVILIPKSEYLEWFGELPDDKQNEMVERWGPPPGKIMVWKNDTDEYLVIPKIQFGNVLLAPDPTWGWLQNESVMYYNGSIPPTHQCLAFYLWLNKEFDADAVFAIFTSIEAMPGKECGLSAHDWGAVLLQDMPLIHILPMDAEGIFDRRRANMLIVDFMTPTIVSSGLYGNLSSLQQEISLYDQAVSEPVKEKYKNNIIAECRNLSLGRDLEVDLNITGSNTTTFKEFVIRLSSYLQELKTEYMPYGPHTLSEPPAGDSLVALVEAMLGDEFKNNVSAINSSEGLTTMLLTEVLLNGSSPDAAQSDLLGSVSNGVTSDLALAVEYANRIDACTVEIPRILDALEGKYILPGSNGDPIRNPDALPTGRDLCTFDARLIPTKEAWGVGKDLADQLLAQHVNETGDYPRKIAFLLWSIETSRHQGTMESEIFHLLGVKPVWDKRGRVKDVKLINSSELGRPRIDVVVTTSGTYRDMYSGKIKLIDKAVRLAAQANDTEYPNYVNESSELIYDALMKTGNYTSEEARNLSMARIFSPHPDSYSTGLQNAIPASNTWNDTGRLANLYIDRMSYTYGEDVWGEHLNNLFRENLGGVEVCIFSRSSNVYGVLDHPEVAAYFGGLGLAIRSLTGETPDMYINNLRDPNDPKVETLSHFMNRELRTRYLNPKWIEGMMEHGYDGSRYMAQFTEDLWMWNVATPDLVTDDMWNQVYDIYVQDPEMQDFFESNNPYAQQAITARMLEAARKKDSEGNPYWDATPEVIKSLVKEYAESVAENGVTCCHHTCANPFLDKFVRGIISVPGVAASYRELMDTATGKMSASS
ncbi:cobaltochelatase subunit CobN, partial [ANME-2 cluster archaeon]